MDSTVRELLTQHLSGYRTARKSWPLWTYSRAPENWGSPRPEPSLVERLRFAHVYHVAGITKHLEDAAGELHGKWVLMDYIPGASEALFFRKVDAELWAPQQIRVPLVWQARAAAVFACLGHPVPKSADHVSFPSRWTRVGQVDDFDREHLERAFGASLETLDFRQVEGYQPVRLFLNFLDVQRQAYGVWGEGEWGKDQTGPETTAEKKRAQRDRRARAEALRARTGASPLATGRTSHKSLLPDALLARLEGEARDFVSEVRSYQVPREAEHLLFALRKRDQELRSVEIREVFRERFRRGRVANADELELGCLRFPFLTWWEIDHIRHSSEAPAALAQRLLAHRLPGRPQPRTIRQHISS